MGKLLQAAAEYGKRSPGRIEEVPRKLWQLSVRHFPKFTEWAATWGWAALMLAALAIEEAHEYGIAFALIFLGATSLVFSVVHWKGNPESKSLTVLGKSLGVLFAMALLCIGCIWIYGQKGTEPLSRFPSYWVKLISPQKPAVHPPPPVVPRPYDLSGERREAFLKLLKPPARANALRIGCLAWDERACLAAGQFLILFSEAGWTIDGKRVFRMDETVPTLGVSITSLPEPGPPLPPHLGRWHVDNCSEVTLTTAFLAMGIQQNGSADASLARGITGVNFGPEPDALRTIDKQSLELLRKSEMLCVKAKSAKTAGTVGPIVQALPSTPQLGVKSGDDPNSKRQ